MDYKSLCVNTDISIRDAMKVLNLVEPKILLITEAETLVAVLTDGDTRRYLMNGGSPDDPAVNAANFEPFTASNMVDAAEVLKKKGCIAVPVIDSNSQLIDVYVGKKIPGIKKSLNIPVVINAGGKGTRLDPFTRVLPKPLIPVGDIPIIEHIMQEFMQFGCCRFHMIVNYKKQLIKAFFNESETRYNVTWYDEETPLGTGGGLSLLRGNMKETFIFSGCDVLLKSDYESIIRYHREKKNVVTMICAYKNITIPYGVVETDTGGTIKEFREKPELSFLTNTGIYVVEPEVIEDIPENVSIGFPDIVEIQRQKGRNVSVYPVSENEWFDMGQITELESMRKRLYGE